MTRKHIVVIGSSFAGFTAAIELNEKLGDRHDITVISKSDQFLFMPSLIWIPFGLRTKEDITFDVRKPLEERGIRFRHVEATRFSLENQTVTTKSGDEIYDYLLIATGLRPNHSAIPGLGPRGYTQSIMTLAEAEMARTSFERFLAAPGPVVVGRVQGASCFGAAYEFLVNMAYQLRKHGIADQTSLTYLTAEPYLARSGIGGFGSATTITEYFFEKLGIQAVTNATVQKIEQKEIYLTNGRKLPFAYAMLMPPFLGVDVVRACESITNALGFVQVNDFCQTLTHPEVFAAGFAVAMAPPDKTAVPCGGVPKTGYLAEEMAKTAAHNIAAHLHGENMVGLPGLPGSAFVAVHQPIRNALGGTDSLRSHCPGNANACESRWLGGASRDALSDSRCPATNAGAKRDGCAHVDHWRGVGGRAAQRCLRGGARHTGATARYHPGPKVPST